MDIKSRVEGRLFDFVEGKSYLDGRYQNNAA